MQIQKRKFLLMIYITVIQVVCNYSWVVYDYSPGWSVTILGWSVTIPLGGL